MNHKMSAADAFQFIRSYGWTPEMSELEQWIKEDPLIQSVRSMDEDWMNRFNDWRRFKGTALEPGINLQEKVDGLLAETIEMKKEIDQLKFKIDQLNQRQVEGPLF